MDINVKPLLCGEKRTVEFLYEIPLDYSDNGYEVSDGVQISGSIKDMGGFILLEAECRAKYNTVCARCLTPISGECSITFSRPVATGLASDNEEEEYLLVNENGCVNIDEPASEELLLSLPFRSLCSEDCKGLCPKCGCNKNVTECECITREIDPRWAALKNFKAKEE